MVVLERISKRTRRAARLLAVAALPALALTLAPAQAPAGQYHVYTCRTPSGEAAPADGWSESTEGTSSVAEDTCSQPGGALVAGLRDDVAHTAGSANAMWTFAAPNGETLAGASLWRAGDAEGGDSGSAYYEFWFAGPSNINNLRNAFDPCVGGTECPGTIGNAAQPLAAANSLVVTSLNLGSHLYMDAACTGESPYKCTEGIGDPNNYAVVVYLYAADLLLEQTTGPTASNVSGELAQAPTVSGTSDIVFDASDPGSGVYEAVFSVDGNVVQRTVVDEDGGRCRNVGETTDGLPAFLYVQPCPSSVSADVGFDTTRIADGTHHLVVSVTDAAGNAATVLDREITVTNPAAAGVSETAAPGAPNGMNASAQATLSVSWNGSKSDRLTSAYDHAQRIVGRLTSAGGAPIGDAQIDISATPDYAGARTTAMADATTSADGHFSVLVPAGVSSRTVRFTYSDAFNASPVAARTLVLAVRAGVILSVAPHASSVGHSIFFSGHLRGGPIPRGGKPLVLEARSPGGSWLEFDVVRSDARGAYHASYRFKFPGPARYQFRVLCEAEADYPFATGGSNIVEVFEH